MRQGVTRREFLACALGIGASLLAGDAVAGGAISSLVQQRTRQAASINVSDLFAHMESARAIGEAYLSTHRAETDEHVLLALISASVFGNPTGLASAKAHEVKQLLQQGIRRDFEADRIVLVEGWILSATEARLCALTAVT